jgi:muconate cycloisomerase
MTVIASISTRIIDIPIIRPHKLSFGSIQSQSYCIVRMELNSGIVGWGEAATIGGASWNEESPESIKHAIDAYIAPVLIGKEAGEFESLLDLMEKCCRGNYFAKSAVEMAAIDATARSLNIPAYQLLGGKKNLSLPLAWTLATGDVDKDLQEAHLRLEERKHHIFKIKIGAKKPSEDVALVVEIAKSLQGKARLTVDINQAWDGNTARRYVPVLSDAGVDLIEQPVAKWNTQALQELCQMSISALIMPDESVCTPQDAIMLSKLGAAHVFSLKVSKHGGLLRTRKVAAVAEASDIGWYGGTMLETSLGSAASAHVFAGLGGVNYGCELFGPQLLVEDIVEKPMQIKDFHLIIPDGIGFGVEINENQLDRFTRKT